MKFVMKYSKSSKISKNLVKSIVNPVKSGKIYFPLDINNIQRRLPYNVAGCVA